ncbi:MAG: NAD(P)-dependent oxidoreductase [Myxococcota bacterium]
MKVLVLGASGFIGGAVARALKARGDDVVVTARSNEAEAALRGFDVRRAELGDPAAIASAADGARAIVHAAGLRRRDLSRKQLGWTHVAGTENVLKAARHAGVSRLVFVSCADVTLTKGPRVHWNEDRMPERPFDAHAETLAKAEDAVIGACDQALRTVVLRPAFVWGPGGSGDAPGPSDLGTSIELCAEGQARGLSLYGAGRRFVATTYIANLVDAVQLALERTEGDGSILNVCDAELSLAGEFYAELSSALGLPKPQRGFGARLSRLTRRYASTDAAEVLRRSQSHSFAPERARERLGFEPQTSHVDGFRALAAWALEQGGAAALAERGQRGE